MDQDATCYGGRLRPRRHCVRWGPSFPSQKEAQQPPFLSHVYCGQMVAHLSNCWALVWLSVGYNISCMIMIASDTLFDTRYLGWLFRVKLSHKDTAEIEVLTDVAMVTIFCCSIYGDHTARWPLSFSKYIECWSKIANFPTSSVFVTPLAVTPLEFDRNLWRQKTTEKSLSRLPTYRPCPVSERLAKQKFSHWGFAVNSNEAEIFFCLVA